MASGKAEKRKTGRATNAAPIFMFKVTKTSETKRSGHSSQKLQLIVWPRFRLAFVCLCLCFCFWLAAVLTWPFHAIFVITSTQHGWEKEGKSGKDHRQVKFSLALLWRV